MNGPAFGEASLGALVSAIVGSVGGLFALRIAPAIIFKNPALLFSTPLLSLGCWVIGGIIGWLIGGQLGPRLSHRFANARLEYVGGVIGGLVPPVLFGLLGWYMVTPH
jgi:hypothetical protein